MQTIECLTLRREVPGKPGLYQWLITNGMSMGRWTINFGINCYADSVDCKALVNTIHGQHQDTTIIIPVQVPLPDGAEFRQ